MNINLIGEHPSPIKFTDRSSPDYKDLVESIRKIGLIQPIAVRIHPTEPGHFQIVDGIARFNACLDLGWNEVPTYIVNLTDDQVREAMFIASVKRIPTKPSQYKAALLKVLALHPTIKMADLSKRIGMSPKWILSMLCGQRLPKLHADKVMTGEICVTNGYTLSRLTKPYQTRHLKYAESMEPVQFLAMVQAHFQARRMK